MDLKQFVCVLGCLLGIACSGNVGEKSGFPEVLAPGYEIELVSEEPDIVTPIGMAIDGQDQLYVLESHTHSPMKEYAGPPYDRIKKGVDANGDGIPESWTVFADSINDGMNLICDPSGTIYLTEKDRVWAFKDEDGDGTSDKRTLILDMVKPEKVYDHAGICGPCYVGGWLVVCFPGKYRRT